jgi:hypothetical protein
VAAYTVNVRRGPESIVSVTAQSVLRLRIRTAKPQHVLALIGLRFPTGGWAGNFQTVIKPGHGARDRSGWQILQIPLSSLKGTRPDFPDGSRVFLIFLAAYSPQADLELAELSITPADHLKTVD